jgi:hypothetical protein
MIGSLIQGLDALGLRTEETPPTWSGSTLQMCTKRLRDHFGISVLNKYHRKCVEALRFNERIKAIIDRSPALLEIHLMHFAKFNAGPEPQELYRKAYGTVL